MADNNMAHRIGTFYCTVCLTIAIFLVGSVGYGQLGDSFGGLPGFGSSQPADVGTVVTASATATIDPKTSSGILTVTADIADGWHIYSVTQKPGGPIRSKISLNADSGVEMVGDPKVLTEPEKKPEPAFQNLVVETHEGQAVWEVPIRLKSGVDPRTVKVTGDVYAQACAESCLPPTNYSFTAKTKLTSKPGTAVAKPTTKPAEILVKVAAFQPQNLHSTLRGWLQPAVVAPGSTAELTVEATPEAGWHVYGLEERPKSKIGARPTLIVFKETTGLRYLKPVASVDPVLKAPVDNELPTATHATQVQWTVKLEIPADAKPGDYPIEGIIGVQSCKSLMTCDKPASIHFKGALTVADAPSNSGPTGLQFAQGKSYDEAVAIAEQLAGPVLGPTTDPTKGAGTPGEFVIIPFNDATSGSTLPTMILFGVLGGLILNLMPCVLPVIGLKILGFAQQAGHNRAKILALNLWYAAGMLVVFLALATLAAGAKLGISEQDLGWGQQFSSTAFNVVMAAVVFVMALSFLGVWEIPIPGFVGSGSAQKMSAQEGASGAFAKGILTTILATPCSGPFLGPVFGFTLTQSPAVIYVIFTAIGLGMALPYLVIGAFPALISWLPKPGAWMDTFKQIMGFVMLGTVAFIFSFMQKEYVVPTFVLLIALWAACWWIGRTPTYEPFGKQATAWLQGGLVAALFGWFAFTQMVPGKDVLPWQPFNRAELTKLTSEGKTVLVDFSADWCATCKLNLRTAIDTQAVARMIETNGVVPMLADWTDGSEEVTQMLKALNSNSIPVLAIFPAQRPGEVIVLKDLVRKQQVLDALQSAGPSRNETGAIARAKTSGV